MVCLNRCCCCIPLRIGCFLVAAWYMINNASEIRENIETYGYLGPEDGEDEENESQKRKVLIVYILRTCVAVVILLVSVIIIYASIKEIPLILKGCAIALWSVTAGKFLSGIILPGIGHPFLVEIVLLSFNIYLASVVFSYAQSIEERGTDQEVSVYVVGRGSQPDRVYTIPRRMPNAGGPSPMYQRGPVMNPYGQYYPQGAYSTQGGPIPGPTSIAGRSLGQAQSQFSLQRNPYIMQQAPFPTQTGPFPTQSGAFPTQPGPNPTQPSTNPAQRTPYPTQDSQNTTDARMPQPFGSSYWSSKN